MSLLQPIKWIVLLAIATGGIIGQQERGQLPVSTHQGRSIGSGGQVFAIAQDATRRIFVAHVSGLLVYDGASWRSVEAPQMPFFCLTVSREGRIVAGGKGSIGEVRRDSAGRWVYVPFAFPERSRAGELIQLAAVVEVVFGAQGELIILEGRHVSRCFLPPQDSDRIVDMARWPAAGAGDRYVSAERVEHRVLVQSFQRGLLELTVDGLSLLPGGPATRYKLVRGVIPWGEESLLVATSRSGLLTLGESGKPLDSSLQDFAQDASVSDMTPLRSGGFALSTDRGVAVVGGGGRLRRLITSRDGLLLSDCSGKAALDHEDGLWVSCVTGVSRVELESPIDRFDERNGLTGSVTTLARFADSIYAGTSHGLLSSVAAGRLGVSTRFERVLDDVGRVWHLVVFQDSLAVCTDAGLFLLDREGDVRRLSRIACHRARVLGDSLLVSADKRLFLLDPKTPRGRSRQWISPFRLINGFFIERPDRVWAVGYVDGIRWRLAVIDLTDSDAEFEIFDQSRGVPDQPLSLVAWRGRMVVGFPGGVLTLDSQSGRLSTKSALHASLLERGLGAQNMITDASDALWFWCKRGSTARARVASGEIKIDHPLIRSEVDNALCFLADADGEVWLGSSEGTVLRYREPKQRLTRSTPLLLSALVSPRRGRRLLRPGSEEIPYSDNSLGFEYSFPSFDAGEETLYRSRLLGRDNSWTDWSRDTFSETGLLKEGRYRFEVEARDARNLTARTGIDFEVAPPWYRTHWAWMLWGALAVTTTAGFGMALTRRSRNRISMLRDEIDQRERVESDLRREIAEHARTESNRKALALQLERSRRLEALGRLAGGVAHDFNNILTVIIGAAELAGSSLAKSGTNSHLEQNLSQITEASERAASLARQLLAYGRGQLLRPETLDLERAITSLLDMLRRVTREDVEIELDVQPETGFIKVDPGQLDQVVVNLVVNASQAMPTGGRVRISAYQTHVVDGERAMALSLSKGTYVTLEVSDTGLGMDEETLDHVFEPFFTRRDGGGGTGLGLASVHGIVEQSGGHIEVESALGKGTTFRVHFPRVVSSNRHAARASIPRLSTLSGIVALLCDDDKTVCRVMKAILESHGMDVLVACDPGEAIRIAKSAVVPIQVLVTDIVMPGMSGFQLASSLKRGNKELRVLFVSGYSKEELGSLDESDPSVDFLAKPLKSDALLSALTTLLSRPYAECAGESEEG